ncbi:MAG TPA: hypothetical protein VFA60_05460 [Terriglobales bacterium]|nr:hypothetical protein [Terriglobales bacterium]
MASIPEILQPMVEKFDLLGDYITAGEYARARELALELRKIYDTGVERATSGRVS